jgi:bifunctional UDP-N-acetylglucosamine pyrophosphorylase/glucosamine-1-phosphate N-acetyltransferase
MALALIILAAGKGTRMNSDLPKVLHRLAGVPLLAHAVGLGRAVDADKIVAMAGYGADLVRDEAEKLGEGVEIVLQDQQLGTGHAAGCAAQLLADFDGDAIVLLGDNPFIRPETIAEVLAARARGADVVVVGFEASNPAKYGRLIRSDTGALKAIVEAKDANAAERAVSLCNSGIICAKSSLLFDLIGEIGNDNASGEYYLTDVVGLANARGLTAGVVICDEDETIGVDSRGGLARAERMFQDRARAQALENGVTLSAPETVFFALDTMIGRDVIIGANVVFGPGVTVENGAEIRAFCHLEGCHISQGALIGPFARLRPGAEISADAHIGNFVEVKNSTVERGAKVNHLSYIGDADIGAAANIGAGTITCNYDGVMKHRTKIGAGAFVGSNTALVAPVSVGAGAMTGSGSVITQDVPEDALALSRVAQVNRLGFAAKFMARLRAVKAQKDSLKDKG